MEFVVCKCAKCDAKIGRIANLWTQIGKKYLTPAAWTGDEKLSVLASGSVRSGDADTLVGGCQLQDAECVACNTNLGQKCLKTPVNHVFNDGQVIFRITSIVLNASSDGCRKADAKIKRVLNLRGDPPATNGHNAAPPTPDESYTKFSPGDHSPTVDSAGMFQLQADLEAQREDINRISATGYQVVSSFENAVGRVEQHVQELKDTIDSVRKHGDEQRDDIASLKTELSDVKWDSQNNSVMVRLDQQLQTTDRVVAELRKAIGKNRSEMTGLREELSVTQEQLQQTEEENARLRQQMDDTRQITQEAAIASKRYGSEIASLRREIQHTEEENTRLSQDMSDTKQVAEEAVITSKEYASEVASLRRDVKQLRAELAKDRSNPTRSDSTSFSSHELDILASNISKIGNRANQIESLQMEFDLFRSRVQRLEAKTSTSGRNEPRSSMDEFSSSRDELSQPNYGGSTRRKRTSTGRDDDEVFDTTPPKRVAVTSDYSSAAATTESQESSPLNAPDTTDLPPLRRTKAGNIDKRSTKRASWATRS